MGDLPVVVSELPFKVAWRTSDGEWTVKAAFMTKALAGSYAAGMALGRIEARVFEDRDGELHEVTQEAIRLAKEAMKAGS